MKRAQTELDVYRQRHWICRGFTSMTEATKHIMKNRTAPHGNDARMTMSMLDFRDKDGRRAKFVVQPNRRSAVGAGWPSYYVCVEPKPRRRAL